MDEESPPPYDAGERHHLLHPNEKLIFGVRRSVFYVRLRRVIITALCLLNVGVALAYILDHQVHNRYRLPPSSSPQADSDPDPLVAFKSCSINRFLSTGLRFLDTAAPLPLEEFQERRDRLAEALVADGIDAFIAEPGYTFKYYANITQPDWEPWEPEERPFLMIIQHSHSVSGAIFARTRFLVPSFELARAQALPIPLTSRDFLPWTTYTESHSPFSTLFTMWRHWGSKTENHDGARKKPRVMVDEEIRDFISRGLEENGFEVVGLSGEVEKVRQVKSEREVGILRAVNTGTVEAIRAVRKCLRLGLREEEVRDVLDETLRAGGLEPFFDIVLFDENASNPHGGSNGSKVLEKTTFILIDVGAHLHAYSSDITRTFFPPHFSSHPFLSSFSSSDLTTKLQTWDLVSSAQSASLLHLYPNQTASSVDRAARTVITRGGYGLFFTHRVGHGIGIKAHEAPYLHSGNQALLRAGMVVTSEPGVYLPGRFGVRVEDVFLVKEDGEAECLSGRRSRGPWDP